MTTSRTLAPLAELAEHIARKLGGVVRILSDEEHERCATIAFEGAHRVLVRDHGWVVTVSLPLEHAWKIQTPAEWDAAEPEIRRALAEPSPVVTIADTMLALLPAFPDLAPSFPGTPVPREGWLRRAPLGVGIFQSDRGVRVVVWIETDSLDMIVKQRSDLDGLAAWLGPALAKQRTAREAAAAEEKRRAALPVPSLEEVLVRLRAGEKISTGGGRWFETYYVKDGELRREVFDEGATMDGGIREADLAKAIAASPDRFRK